MPRGPRLDAPGVLQHVMARGIMRQVIFHDDVDRGDFVQRLARLAEARSMSVYAWALLPNHFHVLVRTGQQSLARSMRSLLTGYAGACNRRHQRSGHVFQNRYKSVVCEEEGVLSGISALSAPQSGAGGDCRGCGELGFLCVQWAWGVSRHSRLRLARHRGGAQSVGHDARTSARRVRAVYGSWREPRAAGGVARGRIDPQCGGGGKPYKSCDEAERRMLAMSGSWAAVRLSSG